MTGGRGISPRLDQDELVHPLYLDVPMLISFLAALEGGVSLEDQATSRETRMSSGGKELKARAGLPSFLTMLSLDMGGSLSAKSEDGSAEEVVAVRRHTEASLFNRLRARLQDANAVTEVRSADDAAGLNPGALVEVHGEVIGNPLLQLLEVMLAIAPFAGIDVDSLLEGKYEKPPKHRGNKPHQTVPAQPIEPDAAEGLRTFMTMAGGLVNSQVRDIVLKTRDDLSAVMTVASSFVEEATGEYLLESEVRVLGKLTRRLESEEDSINLTRRSVMRLLPEQSLNETIESARETMGESMNVSIHDIFIKAPAIQILPLAIFV